MLFKEFCEKALSNDLIGFVEDDIMKDVPAKVFPAYKFLLEEADQDLLTRKIDRFTYAAVDGYNRNILIVKLEEKKRNNEPCVTKKQNINKGDRVRLLGNYPHHPEGVFGTVIRKGHKEHWVVKLDFFSKNAEFNENSLEVVKKNKETEKQCQE